MKWIFGSMILGVAIGYFRLLPKQLTAKINHGMFVFLILMVIALGVKLGSDKDILGKLGSLGWQALVLALLSMIGSSLALWALDRFWPGGKKGESHD